MNKPEILEDALFPWSISVIRDLTRAIITYPGIDNGARKMALAILFDYGYPVSAQDLADKLGVSRRQVTNTMVKLRNAKLIIEKDINNINQPLYKRDIRLDTHKLLRYYIDFEREKWQKKIKI